MQENLDFQIHIQKKVKCYATDSWILYTEKKKTKPVLFL